MEQLEKYYAVVSFIRVVNGNRVSGPQEVIDFDAYDIHHAYQCAHSVMVARGLDSNSYVVLSYGKR